jgi:hypothetical protein
MATRYWRKKSLLVKIESTYGQDAVPTGAANAIAARDVAFTPLELEYENRDIVRPYLGHQEQIVVTAHARLAFACEIAGSGTAGTPPAWGPLLRASGCSELALGTAHAGTAQAGGASTITLANTASGSDGAYRGMRIRLTGGTGAGQARIIAAYDGASKVATTSEAWTTPPDATTQYSIDAQVVYQPVSEAFESATVYFNMDGKRHVMLGARASVQLRLNARSLPLFQFEFTGLVGVTTDTALPTDVFTAWQPPLAVNNAQTSGFALHGFGARLYGLEMNLANQLVYRNLVGAEDVQITDRAPAGTVTIEDPTIAERDYFTRVREAQTGALNLLHGITPGNRVHVHAPAVQLTQPRYENRDSVIALALAARFVPHLGDDELSIQAL